MQTFSVVILLMFIMWLIDKHNRWRTAFKIVLGFVLVCVLAVGGWYGWGKYETYSSHRLQVKECVAHGNKLEACEKLEPGETLGSLPDTPCWTDPGLNNGEQFDQNSFLDLSGHPVPPDPNRVCHPASSKTYDALATRAGAIECFDKKTGNKMTDPYKEFGGSLAACGPNGIQRPEGACKQLVSRHGDIFDKVIAEEQPNCILPE